MILLYNICISYARISLNRGKYSWCCMKDKIESMLLALIRGDEEAAGKIFSEITETMSTQVVSEMVGWERNGSPPDPRYRDERDADGATSDNKDRVQRALMNADPKGLVYSDDGDICIYPEVDGGPIGVINFDVEIKDYDDFGHELDEAYILMPDGQSVQDPEFTKMAAELVSWFYLVGYKRDLAKMIAQCDQMRAYISQKYSR